MNYLVFIPILASAKEAITRSAASGPIALEIDMQPGSGRNFFQQHNSYQRDGKKRLGLEPHFLWDSWLQKAKKDSTAAHFGSDIIKKDHTWNCMIFIRTRMRFTIWPGKPSYRLWLIFLKSSVKEWMEDQGDSLLYRMN